MPTLDFSEVTHDSIEFLDTFTVTRSVQTINTQGRAVDTPKVYPGVVGIVRTSGSAILHYFPEAEHLEGTIVIITSWRLTNGRPTTHLDADIVNWSGRDYTVMQLGDWSRMGSGYVIALCSIREVDQ